MLGIGRAVKKYWRLLAHSDSSARNLSPTPSHDLPPPADPMVPAAKVTSLVECVDDPNLLRQLVFTYWREHFPLVAFGGSNQVRWVGPSYDKYIVPSLFDTGTFSAQEIDSFFSLAEHYLGSGIKGDFCDVGANIGTTTVAASQRDCVERVFGFEPSRENYSFLVANVALNRKNKDIFTINKAVSNKNGVALLGLSPINSGDHRVVENGRLHVSDAPAIGDNQLRATEQVDTCTLDAFFLQNKHNLRYLWVDTQGYEYQVLSGALNLLTGKRQVAIQIEFWPFGSRQTNSLTELCELIAGNFSGYIDLQEFDGYNAPRF